MSADPRRPRSIEPPWQVILRALLVITGLMLLLLVDVHGPAFYVAWALIAVALISEGVATLVHWLRSRPNRGT